MNVVFVGIWIVLAFAIAREHRKLTTASTDEMAA